ncbi:MAG: c-type cytochrome [Bryobacteraceae bacterium]
MKPSVLWIAAALMLESADGRAETKAASGKTIYTKYGCYQCHGREGQGSSATGPRIGPAPIPFSAFIGYLRQPTGQMPPYSRKVLSDSEAADIYAFLESLPKPPARKSIPLLN